MPFFVLIFLLWSFRVSLSVSALCAIIAGTRRSCVLPCTSASLRFPRDGCPSGPSKVWRDGAASRCGRECRRHVCSRGHIFPRSGRFCSRSPSGFQVCCSCLATSEYENSRRLGVDISVHLSLKKNRFRAKTNSSLLVRVACLMRTNICKAFQRKFSNHVVRTIGRSPQHAANLTGVPRNRWTGCAPP